MAMTISRVALLSSVVLTGRILVSGFDSSPDNVSSKLMIHVPPSLAKDGGYDHREALFGRPPYGGSITQNVYYADSDLCDANVDTTKGFPKREEENGKMKPWHAPFILLVDRGVCTFVQKVRNAQSVGAVGVLIADDTCLCDDEECNEKNPDLYKLCESVEPIMGDDGTGADISIPSFLLFKHDSDPIKEYLKTNKPVQAEMVWSLPQPDDHVEYELWTNPTDGSSVSFVKEFSDVAIKFQKWASFSPNQYFYDGERIGCRSEDGANLCYDLCTNNGRYCFTDPDVEHKSVTGKDIVVEILRRVCIWKQYGEDGVGTVWWNYVREFNDRCFNSEYFSDEACIDDAYKHAKVDKAKIKGCISDSGGTESDSTNALLEQELTKQESSPVVVIPTAFVNSAAIRGELNSFNIFDAICAGFASGTAPPFCETCEGCYDVLDCVNKGKCSKRSSTYLPSSSMSESGTVSSHTFYTSFILLIAIFGGIGLWHYKRTKEEMRDQVRGILAEYMPLDDQDGNGPGTSIFGNMNMGGMMGGGGSSGSSGNFGGGMMMMNGGPSGGGSSNFSGGGAMDSGSGSFVPPSASGPDHHASQGSPLDFARGGSTTPFMS